MVVWIHWFIVVLILNKDVERHRLPKQNLRSLCHGEIRVPKLVFDKNRAQDNHRGRIRDDGESIIDVQYLKE